MGKASGFLEIERQGIAELTPIDRIKNWNEFKKHPSDAHIKQQGARCMDCGTPFCHTGINISGMASGCPVNNLIPEWNDLVYKNRWKEALERLHKTNNFPEFTGRICPAPCEGSCVLGLIEPPVTIKNIECAIIDKGWEEGWIRPKPPTKRTGKKVAVIGSGPAGLACADQLNKAGHAVTVFERADRIGGLLMYGIPNMKLDKQQVVDRRVNLMTQEGVKFVTKTEVGIDIQAQDLMKKFDATVICIGSTQPNDFLTKADARDAIGIHFAMEFLTGNTQHILGHAFDDSLPAIHAKDKDVIVIGGGDTGTDCVGTAIRHGAKSVTQLEILPKPPNERAENNPWPEWPKIYRLDYGHDEAKAKWGEDPRQYLVQTKRFVKDAKDQLTGIEIVGIDWKRDPSGRMQMSERVGSEKILPCQLALLAMGFSGPEQILTEQLKLETDPRSNLKAEFEHYTTKVPGLFAAGDCRRGQSLVVWAINEGRGAARECDRFLMGSTQLT